VLEPDGKFSFLRAQGGEDDQQGSPEKHVG
jgi:hypothetical protein